MKNLNLVLSALLVLAISCATAQKKEIDLFTIPLSNPGNPGTLEVEQLTGSIMVTAYEGKEVIVKVTMNEEKKREEKTKNGLKRIGNSNLNISAEENDNEVQIHNEAWNTKTDFDIKVPKNFSLKLSTVNKGDIYVDGVNGEMEISNVNGEITLEGVGGSVIANTTNGELKVSFNSMDTDKEMAFSSFNGNVEVTFPSSLRANVKAKSDMGDIYTDFDMAVAEEQPKVEKGKSSDGYKVKIEQWVRGKINGGGPEMMFKSFNGDIIIKSK